MVQQDERRPRVIDIPNARGRGTLLAQTVEGGFPDDGGEVADCAALKFPALPVEGLVDEGRRVRPHDRAFSLQDGIVLLGQRAPTQPGTDRGQIGTRGRHVVSWWFARAVRRSLGRFGDGFAAWLREFRFTGDVYALPEGTVALAEEPWLEQAYGDAYRRYCSEVPRFFHWRRLAGTRA